MWLKHGHLQTQIIFARLVDHNNNTCLQLENTLSILNSLQHNYCTDTNLIYLTCENILWMLNPHFLIYIIQQETGLSLLTP